MTDDLGRLEDLPAECLQELRARNTLPLFVVADARLQRKPGICEVCSPTAR